MTFIISEIGVNWDGDYELLREMVSEAKEVGCNAVKFQSFTKKHVNAHPENIRLMKSSITEKNVSRIHDIIKPIKIEWFSTPMYHEAVDFLDPFVQKYKIREFDARVLNQNKSTDLFEKVLSTKKQVFISSENSPKKNRFYENDQLRWLYCVPKYPCSLEEINFKNIKDFDGFSNHCNKIIAPITAAVLGAEYIEIHMTSDKSKNFIDNNVSFDYRELKEIILKIRDIEKIKR